MIGLNLPPYFWLIQDFRADGYEALLKWYDEVGLVKVVV